MGVVVKARAFAKKLSDAPLAIVDKRRHGHNLSEVIMDFYGLYPFYIFSFVYISQLDMQMVQF